MKSTDFLQSAIDVQAERGQQYDSPEGERSMGRTVAAFNAITGRGLTEAEGWLLLQVLKDVRQWQNPGQYHHDSALDGVAYASLKAEALHEAAATSETNGVGAPLAGTESELPSWDDAPEWATVLLRHKEDGLYWATAYTGGATAEHVTEDETCELAPSNGPDDSEGYDRWYSIVSKRPAK